MPILLHFEQKKDVPFWALTNVKVMPGQSGDEEHPALDNGLNLIHDRGRLGLPRLG